MALTIINQPPAIAAVKHPTQLELQTNNYLVTAGSKARIRINVGAASNNQAFILTIQGRPYTFTAKTTPNANNGFEYFANADPIEICNELGAIFNGLPFFADNYTFSSNGNSWVQLDAKENGPEWTIQFTPGTTSFSQASFVAGVTDVYQPNFRVVLWLISGTFSVRREARVDANNRARFELEETLEALLPKFRPTSLNLASLASWETNLLFSYTLRWAERYGDNPVEMRRTSANYKAIMGFFSKTQLPAGIGSFTANYISSNTERRFFTHMPRTIELKPHQCLLVYMYSAGTRPQIDLSGRALKQDANGHLQPWTDRVTVADYLSTSGERIVAALVPINYFITEVFGGNVDDFAEIDFGLGLGNGTPANEHYSELIRVVLDHSAVSPSEIPVLFKSAAGVLELVYLEGDRELEVKTSRTLADVALPVNYTTADGEIQVVEAERQREWKLSSGYKQRDFIVWLQELAGSDEVYLVQNDGSLLRVYVTGSGTDLDQSNRELHSMVITVQESFTDKA